MSKYNKLAGKKVVVIGGSSGIGYSAAEASLELGATVFIGSSSQSRCDEAAARMQKEYPQGKIHAKSVNLLDEASIKVFFDWINKFEGTAKGVDHVVFTAGDALQLGPLETLDIEASKSAFDVRFFGIMRVVKVVKSLFNKGGSMVLTTGTVAYKPSAGWSLASGMGGAVESLTRGLAVDLAPIRVNSVCPGYVDTPLWAGMPADAKQAVFDSHAQKLLTKAVGQPEDIAHAYVYLMSSAFATGTVIVLDGGALIV